ncbi:unnamed protein product [marine sediment metagenome]|uniref:Uncharacterized protein n=1 Tax=marine sediment metagenome TaxID=412755 RepID=X1ITC0_9ZZZZ
MESETEDVNLKGEKKPILKRYIERMTKENPYRVDITFKMELIRKSFHLMGLLLLLAYFGFFALYPVTLIVSDSVIVLINQIQPAYELIWGPISLFL